MKKTKKPTYIPHQIWEAVSQGIIESKDLIVWLYIVQRANKNGVCWLSNANIARDLRLGVSTIKRSLDRLSDTGWLSRSGNQKRVDFDIEFKLAKRAFAPAGTKQEKQAESQQSERFKMNPKKVQNMHDPVQNEPEVGSEWTTIINNKQLYKQNKKRGPVKQLVSAGEKERIIFDFKKAIFDLRTQGKNEHADRLAHQLERFENDRA